MGDGSPIDGQVMMLDGGWSLILGICLPYLFIIYYVYIYLGIYFVRVICYERAFGDGRRKSRSPASTTSHDDWRWASRTRLF